MPSFMRWIECHRLFGKELVVSSPLEKDIIPLAQFAPIQFSAISNAEYFGPMIPRIFKLLQEGNFGESIRGCTGRLIQRARLTRSPAHSWHKPIFLHRMLWKYQGWLDGFNGGPMRRPTMRLNDHTMQTLRNGLSNPKSKSLNRVTGSSSLVAIRFKARSIRLRTSRLKEAASKADRCICRVGMSALASGMTLVCGWPRRTGQPR